MHQLTRALEIHQQWLAEGMPIPAAELLARHPELAESLQALLADRDEVDRAVAAADAEQRVLGDFRLLDELGRGGMGVVYRARQRSLDREVALKVLPSHVTLEADAVARFRREATIAARLEHPNIVAIHAVGRDGDTHFFAMELIDGAPLDRTDPRTGQPRSVRQCVELCVTIGEALAHAHALGVLHRDVKPANILVRADGTPVLTDFGLARDIDRPSLTRTGTFAGTPHYVSPEQASAQRDIDARTDVWSLGATLYELLTGQLPFPGQTTVEILDRIHRSEPRDPLRLVPDLAPDLAAIVLKALEKDRARRYATMLAFVDDLRAFLDYRPITARRATPTLRLRRWIRREPMRAALAAVLVLGVPALSLVAGILIANRTAIQVGTREIRRQEQEQRLAQLTMYLEAGEYADALATADLALAERPDDIEAHVLRAVVQVYSGKGDPLGELETAIAARGLRYADRARVHVLTAMQRGAEARTLAATLGEAKAPEELYLDGLTATMRGQNSIIDVADWRRARDTFLRAMLVSPQPRLHYYLKWAAAVGWTGDAEGTALCNRVLLELWPDSPAALLYVAFALRRSDPAKAAAMYRQVLAAGYTHPRIHSSIAECLSNAGDAAGARAANEDALAAYLRREAAGRLSDPERLNIVIKLGELGRHAEAIERVRSFLDGNERSGRAWRLLGWLRTETADYPGAIAALERATAIDEKDTDALLRLANARLYHHDAAGAITAFGRLAELLPNNPMAHLGLGRAMLMADDWQGARAALAKSLAIAPKLAEAHFVLGTTLSRLGDKEASRAALQQAITLKPGLAIARSQLAGLQLESGDTAAAIATCRAGLALDDSEAAMHEQLGAALLRDGQNEAGRAALREAVARCSDNDATHEMLRRVATTAEGAGDRDLAIAALRRTLDFTPTADERAAVAQELQRLGAR